MGTNKIITSKRIWFTVSIISVSCIAIFLSFFCPYHSKLIGDSINFILKLTGYGFIFYGLKTKLESKDHNIFMVLKDIIFSDKIRSGVKIRIPTDYIKSSGERKNFNPEQEIYQDSSINKLIIEKLKVFENKVIEIDEEISSIKSDITIAKAELESLIERNVEDLKDKYSAFDLSAFSYEIYGLLIILFSFIVHFIILITQSFGYYL